MTHPIYLSVIKNQGGKPAHWSIWIPTSGQGTLGKMIHVTGNPATGFFLEFKRNHDLQLEDSVYQTIELGQVDDRYVKDIDTMLPSSVDTIARDRLESVATVVTPPGRSANPFNPTAPNCQNWVFDFMEKLIADGFIAEGARTVLQSAPRVL